MDGLMNVVQSILGAGASVMLPIIIFIVGIIFRVPIKKAIISGITVGIGMIGINLVINVLTTNVGPAAQAMVERFGLNLRNPQKAGTCGYILCAEYTCTSDSYCLSTHDTI